MDIKLLRLKFLKMATLSLKNFREKIYHKKNTMIKKNSKEAYNYPIYPRDSKTLHIKYS